IVNEESSLFKEIDLLIQSVGKGFILVSFLVLLINPNNSFKEMGANASSQLERELNATHFKGNEHYYGLINFGNTCYCNSVIQALYFCQPFREKLLTYRQQTKKTGLQKDNLLSCLADLFYNIHNQKRRIGTIAPKRFITRLKKENELFDNYMQQDAHEFFNYLINALSECLTIDKKRVDKVKGSHNKSQLNNYGSINLNKLLPKTGSEVTSTIDNSTTSNNNNNNNNNNETIETTWVQDIFQGTLTNETKCLNCETTSSKDEDFLDLSVDIEPNVSITHCLRVFSSTETLCGDQKYYCDNCCSKQEAQKRMRIKKLPKLLALHLKRFKYVESLNRHTKLSYKVLFPMELRLFNISDDASNASRIYDLVSVVVHCGSTPNRGHYITLVKSQNFWLLFDDDIVDKIDESNLEDFFGLSDSNLQKNSESAYILFYQSREISSLTYETSRQQTSRGTLPNIKMANSSYHYH
uniref:Ubiquitin carboxyl-terminal hydrolase n=2 Tax=Strongyloides stercoralis TaxID=6248 RepID=A0AAF5CWM7_STRER